MDPCDDVNESGAAPRAGPLPRTGSLRWPATPLAWLALALLAPVSLAAGALCGFLWPLLWMAACLFPF